MGGSRTAGTASQAVCSLREAAGAAWNTTQERQEKAPRSSDTEEVTAHPKWARAERQRETTVHNMLWKPLWPIKRPEPKDHNSRHALGQDAPSHLTQLTPRPRVKSMLSDPLPTLCGFPYPSHRSRRTQPPHTLPSPLPGMPRPSLTCSFTAATAQVTLTNHSLRTDQPQGAKTAQAYPHHCCPCPPRLQPPQQSSPPHPDRLSVSIGSPMDNKHGANTPALAHSTPRNLHPAARPRPLTLSTNTEGSTSQKANFIKLLRRTPGRETAAELPAQTFSPSPGGLWGSGIEQVCPSVPASMPWGTAASCRNGLSDFQDQSTG
ncbi:uncharacterized protein LOC121066421 [Cygnus olor]|uniref:uncharacterized protein LOC121066421 n=1 Tax=Cygnus olor TaxID=8869 RepID=UPI001ADE9EA6|nr:uncharacterized protein LOC121066421 [Cygnus olor]